MNVSKLTRKELDILYVLWGTDEALSATKITEQAPDLNKNTVNALLRKLLRNGLIRVDDIGYSGTVLTRKYKAVLSHEEYMRQSIAEDTKKVTDASSRRDLIFAILDSIEDREEARREVDAMAAALDEYRKTRI
ncbi:MAG: BlaI/MecI/CopY family transcriptional regulator [Lachnospiraceae bacterium]|nr:BlaI/MecI/CopY family transcriptional regulator [Lachnospiraceae bacterium]